MAATQIVALARAHNDVIQRILRKTRAGTRVVFICGNHDEFARQFIGLAFGDTEIVDEAIHTLSDGRRLLVIHGGQFDGVIQHGKWLAYLGDTRYQTALSLNHHFNRMRHRMGLHYWSLSQYLKHKVENAVAFIDDFEHALINEARRRELDGVVCGNIHHPTLREVDGLLYCHDGDWVESLSALGEDADGKLMPIDGGEQVLPPMLRPKHSIKLPALPSTLQRGHIRDNP